MIRHLSGITILLFVIFLAGCQSSDPASSEFSAEDEASTRESLVQPTAVPVPTKGPSASWQIIKQIQPEHQPKYAAFMNELFGVTGCGTNIQPSFTSDGGQTWTQPAIGQFCPTSVDIVDGHSIWLCNAFGLFTSKDGGRTLAQMYSPFDGCRIMNFADDDHGWSSLEWNIAATSDGALRWVEIEKAFDMGEIAALSLRTPQDGYALTYDGILFTTADGGQSWSSHDMGIEDGEMGIANMDGDPAAAIHFADDVNGVVILNLTGGGKGELLSMHTADGGQTWERHLIPLNLGPIYLSHDGKFLTVTELGGSGVISLLEAIP